MSGDFSEVVKRTLASRVGNLCSNPECRTLTSGPQVDPTKAVNVGVAAHITAASPGGPRYDPALAPEERSGAKNGIWLCQTWGKLIDNDRARFSVELLQKWKSDSEEQAQARMGKTGGFTAIGASVLHLSRGARVRISPVVPREHELSEFMLEEEDSTCFVFRKLDSTRQVDIPKSLVDKRLGPIVRGDKTNPLLRFALQLGSVDWFRFWLEGEERTESVGEAGRRRRVWRSSMKDDAALGNYEKRMKRRRMPRTRSTGKIWRFNDLLRIGFLGSG